MLGEVIKRYKLGIAFIGDIAVFFVSMFAVLYGRYGQQEFWEQFSVHREPFLIVLFIWIVVFYISNLYTYKAFGNILEIAKRVATSLSIGLAITITIFYIFSRFFELTPKANLIMLASAFLILDILWRYTQRKIFIQSKFRSNILILSSSPLLGEIIEYVRTNPQLGYSLHKSNTDPSFIPEKIKKENIFQVVIDAKLLRNNEMTKVLYKTLSNQIDITTLTDFYESLFGCIPLSEIEEEWFVREIIKNKSIYESVKYMGEMVLVILMLPIIIPLSLIIFLAIKMTSRGPAIYKQERIGRNNQPFTLYKFRTMKCDSQGPLWTSEQDDRLTPIGRILRHTHLDEIPQLLNVFKGDISFIGPRPERTELARAYEDIPFYEIRHMIKPGIIGWAQLNFKPSTSIEEATRKFQFDLYYIKNRSLTLDLFIFLKTARTVFLKA